MENDNLAIRRMKDEDILFVYSIEKESFRDLWSEVTYKKHKEEKGQAYYIAELGEKIVAYCVTMQVLDECEILKIAVDKSYRRRGIGEKILRTVMSEASKNGARLFYLEVREGNAFAIAMYEKLGFVESGRRKNYYKQPTEDAMLMSCIV